MFTYFKIISTVGKVVLPSLLWNFNLKEKCIYLTFDDGPIPEITPWVLQKLKDYNAKASFFCIGDNVAKNPEIFKMILGDGHAIGNHTYNHLDGWRTNLDTYVENVLKAEVVIRKLIPMGDKSITPFNPKKLFRPPFGRIGPLQINRLKHEGYKIVMWDVISGDYDQSRAPSICVSEIKKYSKPGSIVVMHDSIKAFKNLQKILPEILDHYSDKGYEFRSL